MFTAFLSFISFSFKNNNTNNNNNNNNNTWLHNMRYNRVKMFSDLIFSLRVEVKNLSLIQFYKKNIWWVLNLSFEELRKYENCFQIIIEYNKISEKKLT